MLSKSKFHDHLRRLREIGWHSEGFVEPRPELPVREQVHAQQCHRIRHRPAAPRFQLHEAQQQHRDQSGPHQGVHGCRGGAQERLDLQILLQRFEKQLHRPAVLVDRGDGRGGNPEAVGQELKFPLLLLVKKGH